MTRKECDRSKERESKDLKAGGGESRAWHSEEAGESLYSRAGEATKLRQAFTISLQNTDSIWLAPGLQQRPFVHTKAFCAGWRSSSWWGTDTEVSLKGQVEMGRPSLTQGGD